MSLTEKQLQSLTVLWTGLPDAARQKLLLAAGPSGKLADTLKILDETVNGAAGERSILPRLLFRIFDDVTGDDSLPPSHARFSSATLEDIFEIAELANLRPDGEKLDPEAVEFWRQAASVQVSGLVQKAETDKALKKTLIASFGAEFPELLTDAACLLEHGDSLSRALAPFGESVTDLNPELVDAARDAYEEICADAPDASLWFLKLLTARLDKTAQIFRVVEKIGRRSDDALVSKTDLADVGDLVLANTDFYAGQFVTAPATLEDANTAGKALEAFVKVSVGMTREFGIRKDGHWGKTLFAARAKASSALESQFKQVEKSFSRALPHPVKGKKGLAKAGPLPSSEKIQQAEAELRFLALASEWATQAAVGSAQKHAADFVTAEIDECSRALMEILRAAEGDDCHNAFEGLELIVRYLHAFCDDENADLIQRRSVAIRANAA
ncbi:MAG: hypothetical protein DHS20C06_15330 [Hyphobacterium sp.]|nr:MAG: hypothetical protein DHS20C06_15330 [Hyphobacterium sp.]